MMEYSKLAKAVLSSGAYQAILYISPNRTIKATRKRFKGKFSRSTTELLFTDGKPNYTERKRIKELVKAKEPFPVKKIQLKIAAANVPRGTK